MNRAIQYDTIGKNYVKNVTPTKEYSRVPTILAMTGPLDGKDVLDLACGDGYQTRKMAEYHPRSITGIDISEVMITLAQNAEKTDPKDIHYLVGNALNLPYQSAFDIVTSIYLLDYAESKDELTSMCSTVFRALRPGGIFASITMSPKLKPRSTYLMGWKIEHPENKTTFSDGDAIRLVSDSANGPPLTIYCRYWSQQTYEECFHKAGFDTIQWKYDFEVSEVGKQKYPPSFWNEVKKSSGAAAIRAEK